MSESKQAPYLQEPQLIMFRRRLAQAIRASDFDDPAALANATGQSESALRRYLNGTRLPGCAALVRLSKALGVSCDWLLGFDYQRVPAYSAHSGKPPQPDTRCPSDIVSEPHHGAQPTSIEGE